MKKIFSYLLLLPVYFYRGYISPMTPPSCRFVPTCSEYAIEAIKKYGPFKGLYLAVRRILRCHPWGGSGYDPVPYIRCAYVVGYSYTSPGCCVGRVHS